MRLNEKSFTLWHKRLGHISRQRIERLIKDEILPDLDFSDFDIYVDYIKGKLTAKVRNAKIDRCIELLWVYSYKYLWAIYSSCYGGLQKFPVLVLSSSFVRSLTLWRLSKLLKKKLSFNKGRRSKWFILIEAVSIMVETRRNLGPTFRNVALMLSIQCMVLLNKMGLGRGEIAHFLI